MKALLLVSCLTGLVFLLFGGTLGWGVVKRQKGLKRVAFGLLGIFSGLMGWIGLRLATKSYHKLTAVIRPRTGDEIYAALFGQQQIACVKVLNQQDQVIPRIDYAIWLQVETCPEEVKRILSLHNFAMQKQATAGWDVSSPAAHGSWFKPESLGDSVLVFTYRRGDYGSGQTLYSSTDSTRVFCVDFSE